eukprot:Em0009g1142a
MVADSRKSLQAELQDKRDKLRKLKLVQLYNSKNNLQKLEELICKWRTSEHSQESKVKKDKKKKRKPLTINLTHCKYDCVRRVAVRFGLKPITDDEDWTVYWTDTSVLLEGVLSMGVRKYQKINHFPGMSEICRKDLLARNMNRMRRAFPRDYNCFPRTWCLPADYGDLQAYCRTKKKTFIAKPENSCQGKGIFVFKNLKDLPPGEHLVCQEYIAHPFTLDGFKFDLRIYVLVTSCDPLYIYVYNDGLARLATMQYQSPSGSNMKDVYMHLTNYAINKHNKEFVNDDECGSKRKLSSVNKWLEENGYDIQKLWQSIEDVIIKTIISAHPVLKHNYRSCFPDHNQGSACFEVLGFDILIDRKFRPWLLEVNHSPSFHTDAPIDREIKEAMLYDTLELIDLFANDKKKCQEEERRKVQDRLLKQPTEEVSKTEDSRDKYYAEHVQEYEHSHLGGYRRIYPGTNNEYYAPFFNQSTSLCAETVASKARTEMARQLREEIESKQREMAQYLQRPAKKSKNEEAMPESPGRESAPAKVVVRRRRPSFRLPAPEVEVKKEAEPEQPHSDVPSAVPEAITEEEEGERLAGLQLRDRLLRGLGMFDQIEQLLQKKAIPPSHPNPSQQPAEGTPSSGPGMHGKSISHTSLPPQVQLPPTSSSLTSVTAQARSESFAQLHQRSTLPLHRLNAFPKPPRLAPKAHKPASGRQPISLEFTAESLGLSVVSTSVRLASRTLSHSGPSERRSNYLLSTRLDVGSHPLVLAYPNLSSSSH